MFINSSVLAVNAPGQVVGQDVREGFAAPCWRSAMNRSNCADTPSRCHIGARQFDSLISAATLNSVRTELNDPFDTFDLKDIDS